MKAIFFLLSTILMLPLAANAQMPSGTFLFEEFTEGTILLTNKKTIETRFNYDCDNQVLYFLNGNIPSSLCLPAKPIRLTAADRD